MTHHLGKGSKKHDITIHLIPAYRHQRSFYPSMRRVQSMKYVKPSKINLALVYIFVIGFIAATYSEDSHSTEIKLIDKVTAQVLHCVDSQHNGELTDGNIYSCINTVQADSPTSEELTTVFDTLKGEL